MTPIEKITIKEARKLLDAKEISTTELVKSHLKNVEEKNIINLFIQI